MTSPSSHGREKECLASTILPQRQSTGPGAARGKDIHAFMCKRAQATTDEERDAALDDMDERWRGVGAALDWSRLPQMDPTTGVAELALAWSPSTGRVRELGRNGKVEHDDVAELLEGDEMGGIIDWLSLTPDAVFIADWKSGYATLERAEVNNQLKDYGFMAAKLFGFEKAIVSYARLYDDGKVGWDIAEMDALKLDAAEAGLRQHLKNVAAAKLAYRNTGVIPTPHEGDWCRYCPAQASCPAKVALLLSAFVNEPGKAAQLARLPEPLTHEAVAALWPKLKAAKTLVEELQKNVKDYVRVFGGVKLPNGQVLGEVEGVETRIVGERARETLLTFFKDEDVDRVLKPKVVATKKSLKEVLRDYSSHGTMAKLERKVLAKLDDAGALDHVPYLGVEEVSANSKRLRATLEQQRLQERQRLQAANDVQPEEPPEAA